MTWSADGGICPGSIAYHLNMTIQGERNPASGTAGEKVHRSESRYGTFRRSITLPSHVQADKIEASAQDGVLQILVPKAKEMHATRIQVATARSSPP